jgi:hypothetical protein
MADAMMTFMNPRSSSLISGYFIILIFTLAPKQDPRLLAVLSRNHIMVRTNDASENNLH